MESSITSFKQAKNMSRTQKSNPKNKYKYLIVGGNPFLVYTKGLRVIGRVHTEDEVRKLVAEHYDECAGLMLIIDLDTGCAVEKGLNLKHDLFQSARISSVLDSPENLPPQEQIPIQ